MWSRRQDSRKKLVNPETESARWKMEIRKENSSCDTKNESAPVPNTNLTFMQKYKLPLENMSFML